MFVLRNLFLENGQVDSKKLSRGGGVMRDCSALCLPSGTVLQKLSSGYKQLNWSSIGLA